MPVPSDFPVSKPIDYEISPLSSPIPFLHMHDSLEVGFCTAGAGILMVEDRVMSFQAGDVSVVNNTEMHMSRGASTTQSRWTYFWCHPVPLLASMPEGLEAADQSLLAGQNFPNIISPSTQPVICQLVPLIIHELRNAAPGHRMVVRSLMGALMALLHRMCQEQDHYGLASARTGVKRVSPALHHLAEHFAEEVSVQVLARLCHLSVPHFRRVFLATMGVPPLHYLAQVRVRMAAGILREQPNRPITDVAYAVGFESINTFNRQFLKTVGMSPRHWRQHTAVPRR